MPSRCLLSSCRILQISKAIPMNNIGYDDAVRFLVMVRMADCVAVAPMILSSHSRLSTHTEAHFSPGISQDSFELVRSESELDCSAASKMTESRTSAWDHNTVSLPLYHAENAQHRQTRCCVDSRHCWAQTLLTA